VRPRAVACRAALVLVAIALAGCFTSGGSPWSWSARRVVPGGSRLAAVDCPTPGGCVALTAAATSVRLEGSTWSAPIPIEHVASDDAPDALSCVSVVRCVAIDGLGRALLYNGHGWADPVRIEATPDAGTLSAVSCASADFCAVGDSNGEASIFDGKTWSRLVPVADSSGVAALSCPSVGVCFAVDDESDEAFRYADGRWSISADLNLSTPQGGSEPNSLGAISCGDRTFCVALDEFGDAFTYDGKWSSNPQTFDNIENEDEELSCTAAHTCVAVDDSNDVITYEDGAWNSPHQLGTTRAMVDDISCGSRSHCLVLDDRGGYFVGRPA
jgi:hypothetical protein